MVEKIAADPGGSIPEVLFGRLLQPNTGDNLIELIHDLTPR
jgi:hypothetical protein